MKPLIVKHLELRTVLKYSFVFLLGLSFLSYSIFQARFLLQGPQLTIIDPLPAQQAQRAVTIQGQADNIVRLTLNGREIFTNKTGYFETTLVLENGYTVATFAALDRYGRTRTYEQEFIYTPAITNNQFITYTNQYGSQKNN